ncbi:MAG: hydroxymethylglutaryl-CoA reductase, degradative [Candidatus Altiarchaeota archaeon]|nr:hydroxymethylglutaryl-CoA reductase, degradative [Candidatus Altiarchaeota archaeon]
MMDRSSRFPGFYKLSVDERIDKVRDFSKLGDEDVKTLSGGLTLEQADRMIENVIGVINIPLGVATNFLINGRDYLVPMATEEPSIVAAASNAAKLVREGGGFRTSSTEPVMIGQIQLIAEDPEGSVENILKNKERIIELANEQDPTLVSLGGGAEDLDVRIIDNGMLVVHLYVNVQDAMGANAVNTMCEAAAPYIEELTNSVIYLRILSNLATERIAMAECVIPTKVIGEEAVEGIVQAYEFAAADIYRATTHNKGIMNGITAVALATGNDTRAVEAGAHAYASINGGYMPLTKWAENDTGDLMGEIMLPLAVGTFGGATMNPVQRVVLKILGVQRAKELSEVMAAVGLAQNLAALKALTSEGIQRGHMALHAKNVAMMAGARDDEIEGIAEKLIEEKNIRVDRAAELLKKLRGKQE